MKCDEARPVCLKCRKAGRDCAGYQTVPVGSISWSRLLSSGNSIAEARSLDLFRDVVEPALSGPFAGTAWRTTMLQLSRQRKGPARDAILAISLLFESSLPDAAALRSPSTPDHQQRAAFMYYNNALRHAATEHLDSHTVLCLSILFCSIELLRHNSPAAFEHCRHGLHILKDAKTDKDISKILLAVFRHLTVFPSFSGTTLSDYPLVVKSDLIPCHGFKSINEAAGAMDSLMSRSARLSREFKPFRQGLAATSKPNAALLAKWQHLRQDLDTWYSGLSSIRRQPKSLVVVEEPSLCRVLELRWLVCDIWVEKARTSNETRYDDYRGHFERIRELAREEAYYTESRGDSKKSAPPAEKGLSPMLHFAVLKCRFLRLRLEILALLQRVASQGEALWDAATMEAVCWRIIELEHGMERTSSQSIGPLLERFATDEPALPSEEQRVMSFYLEDDTQAFTLPSGPKAQRRPISFVFRRDSQGTMGIVKDWIIIRGDN